MHVWVQVGVAVCVWSIRCMYVCKWVWPCVCGQLGALMCASGCGSVCVVDKVHVCVQMVVAGCVWLIRCMYVCKWVWQCV